MKYQIDGISYRSGKGSRMPRADITQKQFDEFQFVRRTLLEATAFEERLLLVVENLYEFECELLQLAQRYLIWRHPVRSEAMRQRLLLDRRLINLLAICTLYRDQSAHTVSNVCGKKSPEFVALDSEKSRLYDCRFGYRFMEALRDHVQHRSLAVKSITFSNATSESPEKGGRKFIEVTVVPKISTAALQSDGEFNSGILRECLELGEEIDLRGPVREYVWTMVEIHNFARGLLKPTFDRALATHKALTQSFNEALGETVDGFSVSEIDDSKAEMPFQVSHFDNALPDYYHHLLKQEVNTSELRRR